MNKYKRIVLKVSGEALAGGANHGISNDGVVAVAQQIKKVVDLGVELGVVVGGGNFWRGRTCDDMNRATADYIGMMATVMNALALGEGLTAAGVKNKVVSSLAIDKVCETYFLPNVQKYLAEGYVVIFAGGTGSPFFSTDTCASLRACEIGADAMFCAKAIDAVYDSDPAKNPNAVRFDEITFDKIIADNLKVLDLTSVAMCREFGMPVVVYGKDEPDGIIRLLKGEKLGTVIHN